MIILGGLATLVTGEPEDTRGHTSSSGASEKIVNHCGIHTDTIIVLVLPHTKRMTQDMWWQNHYNCSIRVDAVVIHCLSAHGTAQGQR